MKKYYSILFSVLFMLLSAHCFAQGVWTWMSGTDSVNWIDVNGLGVYGTQDVPSVNNHPPAIYSPYCWTDLQGNFWLYDAFVYADLWKFNPSTLEWTWVNGNGQTYVTEVPGTQGVPALNNTPGTRQFSGCTWVDLNNDLWLYSGSTISGLGADLWRYNIASNEWTWMSGASGYIPPNYGLRGIPSPLNTPGGRGEIGSSWVDVTGKFWLYGGESFNSQTSSDMWMYDPSFNMWTWESGADTANAQAIYGTKGLFSVSNTPGARWPYSMWTDNCGNLWLYGGEFSVPGSLGGGARGDLWEYNISLDQWAWINGTTQFNANGIAGSICKGDSSYYPDGRYENRAAWKDSYGNFWMYGGTGLSNFDLNPFGDMWVYMPLCNEWARMSDGSFLDSFPYYGTMGVTSTSNSPGARFGTGHWQDAQGNFWIYGGMDEGDSLRGDMWMYKPDISCISNNCLSQIPVSAISTKHDTICPGTTANLKVDGITGSIQWQSSTTPYNFQNISGATDSTLNQVLSQTTNYRIIEGNGTCVNTSLPFTLTVIPSPLSSFTNANNGATVTFNSDSSTGNITSYLWNFGDGDSSSLPDPIHTYDTLGTYHVCLTVNNNTNCNFTLCRDITLYPTGTNDINSKITWQVYPDPFTNEFYIVTTSTNPPIENIEIYNVLGQMLLRKDFAEVQDNLTIDASGLANGMYFLKIKTKESDYVQPVVKE